MIYQGVGRVWELNQGLATVVRDHHAYTTRTKEGLESLRGSTK